MVSLSLNQSAKLCAIVQWIYLFFNDSMTLCWLLKICVFCARFYVYSDYSLPAGSSNRRMCYHFCVFGLHVRWSNFDINQCIRHIIYSIRIRANELERLRFLNEFSREKEKKPATRRKWMHASLDFFNQRKLHICGCGYIHSVYFDQTPTLEVYLYGKDGKMNMARKVDI